jgi:urea carboxylase
MFRKVLIANRGVIASRISRTLRRMGVLSVAVYSEADKHSPHVEQCDEAVAIGPAPASQSYLSVPAILQAIKQSGAEAVHPGYGFLSEDAGFAEACADAGVVFVGPTPAQLRDFGLKHTARAIAAQQGLPMLPGTDLLDSLATARREARRIGYPVMLKSTAGGGGIGMRLCPTDEALDEAYAAVEHLSKANFGGAGLYLEKFVREARHIEVQIFGDGQGSVIALGERDCSAQRRNQKVIEETPAPGLPPAVREQLLRSAVALGEAVEYQSAGTVEFLYDNASDQFYFLEVNTRLQVEHGVTEEVTGIDLVEWMVLQAAGGMPPLKDLKIRNTGCSIQARCYAEDPGKDFQPSSGRILHVAWPADARIETWIEPGIEITPFYDPMLSKIIVHGETREAAVQKLQHALDRSEVDGIETNLQYLRQIARSPGFTRGGITTHFLRTFDYRRNAIDVLDGGTQTTIQDYPGRLGYWHVGVPPSGPMDSYAFRMANRLVGNPENAAGLEITLTGVTLRFSSDAVIALTGTNFGARLNGEPILPWSHAAVRSGSTLEMGAANGAGARAYLAVRGGLEAPRYLGSRSTFILGRFGGQTGRVLRSGDVLHIADAATGPPVVIPVTLVPRYGTDWEIGVLYGPHGAPDFFTAPDIDMLFATAWTVHYNSDRTGIRLIGPKPKWARKDGGEAGLHPSNIHDNAYAVGTMDFTGDMPVILGPDGPSLGGFVCPITIVEAERWKMGQLKPGDSIKFRALSLDQAIALDRERTACIQTLEGPYPELPLQGLREEPVLQQRPALNGQPSIVCRADGDRYLLIEYGPNILDLNLRFRVHALEQELRRVNLPGIVDITPGVRSLHIHYDSRLRREEVLEALSACEERIPDMDDIEVPSRTVYLPLSWDDPATQLAIQKYMQSVRPDAPWCPSNLDFIRRINGLASIDDVRTIVLNASYLVLGLGDVYLGAPVATPLDPRHRLVTTKYNPARTWTPENAVGIGGAYLCVYGMEGPGGYQLVGRTLQMWNTFEEGTPWLLRFFDQLRFLPVSAKELLEIREEFPRGRYPLKIEERNFRLREYHQFLNSIEASSASFKRQQQEAFVAERERWAAAGQAEYMDAPDPVSPRTDAATLPEGCRAVLSPVTASVWSIAVQAGQKVEAGERIIVLDAMKMEIAVTAPKAGRIEEVNVVSGAMVSAGQRLAVLRELGA